MASLTEILIKRGIVPIEKIGRGTALRGDDEETVRALVAAGHVSPSQLASARAAQIGLPFVELLDYPVDPSAIRAEGRHGAGCNG
jgi:type IV pilus assembly protein PilB